MCLKSNLRLVRLRLLKSNTPLGLVAFAEKQYAAGLSGALLSLKAFSSKPLYNGCVAGPWRS
jgi:hypothetical protein